MEAAKRHKFPSGRQDQYIVRFPDGMRERIKSAAEMNCRTMNAEIIFQLGKAYSQSEEEKSRAAV